MVLARLFNALANDITAFSFGGVCCHQAVVTIKRISECSLKEHIAVYLCGKKARRVATERTKGKRPTRN
jgi:hypothetical protein